MLQRKHSSKCPSQLVAATLGVLVATFVVAYVLVFGSSEHESFDAATVLKLRDRRRLAPKASTSAEDSDSVPEKGKPQISLKKTPSAGVPSSPNPPEGGEVLEANSGEHAKADVSKPPLQVGAPTVIGSDPLQRKFDIFKWSPFAILCGFAALTVICSFIHGIPSGFNVDSHLAGISVLTLVVMFLFMFGGDQVLKNTQSNKNGGYYCVGIAVLGSAYMIPAFLRHPQVGFDTGIGEEGVGMISHHMGSISMGFVAALLFFVWLWMILDDENEQNVYYGRRLFTVLSSAICFGGLFGTFLAFATNAGWASSVPVASITGSLALILLIGWTFALVTKDKVRFVRNCLGIREAAPVA